MLSFIVKIGQGVLAELLPRVVNDLYDKSGEFIKGKYSDDTVRSFGDFLKNERHSPDTKKANRENREKKKKTENAIAIGGGIIGVAAIVFGAWKATKKK